MRNEGHERHVFSTACAPVSAQPMDAQFAGPSWNGKFWRVFLATGVPFGGQMALIGLIDGRIEVATGCAMGALFGLLMAWTLVRLDRSATKADRPLATRQVRSVEMQCDRETCVRRVIDAMVGLGGTSFPTLDPRIGAVVKRTGFSWKSWGDRVTGRIEPVAGGGCRVEIESKPRFQSMLDYGANAAHADAVVRALRDTSVASSALPMNFSS